MNPAVLKQMQRRLLIRFIGNAYLILLQFLCSERSYTVKWIASCYSSQKQIRTNGI